MKKLIIIFILLMASQVWGAIVSVCNMPSSSSLQVWVFIGKCHRMKIVPVFVRRYSTVEQTQMRYCLLEALSSLFSISPVLRNAYHFSSTPARRSSVAVSV
jgi:hypothetical protein